MPEAHVSSQEHPETRSTRILRSQTGELNYADDTIVAEEPLEIMLEYAQNSPPEPFMLTMRSPGADADLIAGLLYAEGVIHNYSELGDIQYPAAHRAVVRLRYLKTPGIEARFHKSNAACGVCGISGIEALNLDKLEPVSNPVSFQGIEIGALNKRLHESQSAFEKTGGIHAAALIDLHGNVIHSREDVGRHNAVDKVIGGGLREHIDLPKHGLLISSRIGYEIVQKAAKAQISLIIAIGAASSLAVELADALNICLVGFLKENSHNIYTHPQRILEDTHSHV